MTSDPHRVARPGEARPVSLIVLVLAVLLSALAASVPASNASFSAVVRNTANVATVRSYFTCAAAVAADTPAYYYRMDESTTTTTATDSSGNNRTGVYSSTGRTVGAGRACTRDSGTAMTFNGSSGYLSSPIYGTSGPNTFTEEIWFKTNTTRGGKLIGWGSGQLTASLTYDRHIYMTDAGLLIFGINPGTRKTITTTTAYNDNQWHQVTATLSSAGMKLYVDGALKASDASGTSGEGSLLSGYWRIGYDSLLGWPSAPTSYYFGGTLDDAAVYLTALSASQVKAHYDAGT